MKNELYDRIQTPCYILHEEKLYEQTELLKSSFRRYWPNAIAGYSFKTNALPWMLERIKEAGFYAEVVSPDEYALAERLGFENIIYNGPVKDFESFKKAMEKQHIVNLDAERELDWLSALKAEGMDLTKARTGLRVNMDFESRCPGETSAGEAGSRFGFSVECGAFEKAVKRLKELEIPLLGLHLHLSSKTRSIAIYRELAKAACEIAERFSLKLKYVDLGGGYVGGLSNRPQFPDYLECISAELKKYFDPEKILLIMEPGTSICTPPFEYITSVIDVKDTYAGRIVVTDGSREDIDPLHAKSSYFHELAAGTGSLEDRAVLEEQSICGYTCMEGDRLFCLKDAPELRVGDHIHYKNVGGYTLCLTPLFIRYFPEVYVETDGVLRSVRGHWGPEEYIQRSLLEK